MTVPTWPSMAGGELVEGGDDRAAPPARTNRRAASTFGPIEPDAKWPAAAYASISASVTRPMSWASGVPQPATAWATSVAMTSTSAPTARASRAAVRSLSMTASTPWTAPSAAADDGDAAAAGRDDDVAGGEQR